MLCDSRVKNIEHEFRKRFLLICHTPVANVQKWEKTLKEDDKELEKLKKEEQKQMKVCLKFIFVVLF